MLCFSIRYNGRRLMQSGDIETVTVSPVTNIPKRTTLTLALPPALPQPFVVRLLLLLKIRTLSNFAINGYFELLQIHRNYLLLVCKLVLDGKSKLYFCYKNLRRCECKTTLSKCANVSADES